MYINAKRKVTREGVLTLYKNFKNIISYIYVQIKPKSSYALPNMYVAYLSTIIAYQRFIDDKFRLYILI